MKTLRHRLGPLAAAWLSCQVAMLIAAPVVSRLTPAEALLECTCAHGDHAICPMHHKPAADSKVCLMRSADESGTAVLSSLLGGVGVVPAITQLVDPQSPPAIAESDTTTPSRHPRPPDSPPPRP